VVVNPYFELGARTGRQNALPRDADLRSARQGLTIAHPEIPEEERGTLRGLAHPVMIEHLQRLGVTGRRA